MHVFPASLSIKVVGMEFGVLGWKRGIGVRLKYEKYILKPTHTARVHAGAHK